MESRQGDTGRRPNAKASSSRVPLITLLTDFGTTDHFVAALKGVILSTAPAARIVDITHEIPPQDIEAAAFTLLAAHDSFPAQTIHVAVVDPGVGSTRRPLLLEAREQYFVGPDNGLFSYVCEGTVFRARHLTNSRYFRHPVSPTFNGRDIFAPVAAALAGGIEPKTLGPEVSDLVRLKSLQVEVSREGKTAGRIVHIDRFGNCVTNITPAVLSKTKIEAGAKLKVNGKTVRSFRNYFAEESNDRQKLFAVWGSAGFLEIAMANASAAKILKAQRGDSVAIT